MVTRSYILSDAYTFINIVGKVGKWYFHDKSIGLKSDPFDSKLEAIRAWKKYLEECVGYA